MNNTNLRVTSMSALRAIPLGLAVALLAHPLPASAHNYTGSCTVNFDNSFALTNIYANARATFGSSTGYNSAGKLDVCSNVPSGICWTYRHRCATNYVNQDDLSGYGHYHLSFQNSGYNPLCGFYDPGDGYGSGFKRTINSVCSVVNWTTEPRVMNSHDGGQWVGIKMQSQSGVTTIFDMPRIRIGGSAAIQFWFHSTLDNKWYNWSSLGPNNWNLSAYVHDVDLVEISGASGPAEYEIDDYDILD
jgi:hypothetical protein